jgi:hypothetical protein
MNIIKPLKVSEINLEKIIYDNIRGYDKRYVLINYEKPGQKLLFQTPQLLCSTLPVANNGYYDLDIPLYGKSMRKVNKFIKLLNDLDNKCVNDCKKNAKNWFYNRTNIKYKSLIRDVPENNKVYENGVIKIKLLDGYDKTNITTNGKESNISEICTNQHIRIILEVFALLITEDGFSLYLKPHLLDQQIIKKYQFSFVDDSDSDSILYTEIGGDEGGIELDPKELFIKDSETSAIPIEKKQIEKNQINIPESSEQNSDKLLDDEDNLLKDITETNDESMYETATMTCDYNNMKKNRK